MIIAILNFSYRGLSIFLFSFVALKLCRSQAVQTPDTRAVSEYEDTIINITTAHRKRHESLWDLSSRLVLMCYFVARKKFVTTKIVYRLPMCASFARQLRWDRRLRSRPISSQEPTSLTKFEVGALNPSAITATLARCASVFFATSTLRNIIAREPNVTSQFKINYYQSAPEAHESPKYKFIRLVVLC